MLSEKIDVFFLKSHISTNDIRLTTIEELETYLQKIDSYKKCIGGPPSTHYNDVDPQCAYKDGSIWRHASCSEFIEEGRCCKYCCTLSRRLDQYLTRTTMRRKFA